MIPIASGFSYTIRDINKLHNPSMSREPLKFKDIISSKSDEEGVQYGKVYAAVFYDKDAEYTTYKVTNTEPYKTHPGNLSRKPTMHESVVSAILDL